MSLEGKTALITAGSRGIGRAIALKLAEQGVRIEGGVLRSLPPEVQETTRQWYEGGWTPMRRLGTPEDVANTVMLLCTKEAGFITGQILHVDGGASIMDPVYPLTIQQG